MIVSDLTPALLQALMVHCQNLSKCKPRKIETILKLARAQTAITRALEPFEQVRDDLLATLPPEPPHGADPTMVATYRAAKNDVDAKFREIFSNGKFSVDFPEPIQSAEFETFQEPPSPNDLAALHPYVVDLAIALVPVEKSDQK